MILVTGANGFIGSALVCHLNQEGFTDLICVDSVSCVERPLPLQKKHFSKFLLKDEIWDFLEHSQASSISVIIHMGACSSTTETNREFLLENNTLYTQKLFEWCEKNKVHFIYASSGATYGDGTLGFNDDIDPEQLKPLNLYGESKIAFDRWIIKQKNIQTSWHGLRFFNVYGAGEKHKNEMSSLVYKAFHQIRQTGKLKLFKSHRSEYKDGEQVRDFVYVKDISRWIIELLRKQNTTVPSGIYNMGFGKARSWLDLAHAVFVNLDKPLQIEWIYIPEAIRSQYQYRTEASIQKLLKSGMTFPQWALEDGVADYFKNYLLQNKDYM